MRRAGVTKRAGNSRLWRWAALLSAALALCLLPTLRTALRLSMGEEEEELVSVPYVAGKTRIAYFITVGGMSEVDGFERLLRSLYHPYDLFYVHLDARATHSIIDVKRIINDVQGFENGGRSRNNVVLLDNPLYITWGGFTTLVAAMYGLAAAIVAQQWDYWINLSAHDMPLMPPDELREVLSQFKANATSFIAGTPYSPELTLGVDWRRQYADDGGLYRKQKGFAGTPATARLPAAVTRHQRPQPTLFDLYVGELWVVLHRDLAEYLHNSPDNTSRSLLAYLSKVPFANDLFFPTAVCYQSTQQQFNVLATTLRYTQWPATTDTTDPTRTSATTTSSDTDEEPEDGDTAVKDNNDANAEASASDDDVTAGGGAAATSAPALVADEAVDVAKDEGRDGSVGDDGEEGHTGDAGAQGLLEGLFSGTPSEELTAHSASVAKASTSTSAAFTTAAASFASTVEASADAHDAEAAARTPADPDLAAATHAAVPPSESSAILHAWSPEDAVTVTNAPAGDAASENALKSAMAAASSAASTDTAASQIGEANAAGATHAEQSTQAAATAAAREKDMGDVTAEQEDQTSGYAGGAVTTSEEDGVNLEGRRLGAAAAVTTSAEGVETRGERGGLLQTPASQARALHSLRRSLRQRQAASTRTKAVPLPKWLDVKSVKMAAESGALFVHMVGTTTGTGYASGAWIVEHISNGKLKQERLTRFWQHAADHGFTANKPQLCEVR